jgi:hypothetical protein
MEQEPSPPENSSVTKYSVIRRTLKEIGQFISVPEGESNSKEEKLLLSKSHRQVHQSQ